MFFIWQCMIVNTKNILPKLILNIFLNILLYEALKMNEYLSHNIKEEDCKMLFSGERLAVESSNRKYQ